MIHHPDPLHNLKDAAILASGVAAAGLTKTGEIDPVASQNMIFPRYKHLGDSLITAPFWFFIAGLLGKVFALIMAAILFGGGFAVIAVPMIMGHDGVSPVLIVPVFLIMFYVWLRYCVWKALKWMFKIVMSL